jgi:hypothetical protein
LQQILTVGFGRCAPPVIVFALLIATGAQAVEKAFSATGRLEFWARLGTGAVFILIGVGLTVSELAA